MPGVGVSPPGEGGGENTMGVLGGWGDLAGRKVQTNNVCNVLQWVARRGGATAEAEDRTGVSPGGRGGVGTPAANKSAVGSRSS